MTRELCLVGRVGGEGLYCGAFGGGAPRERFGGKEWVGNAWEMGSTPCAELGASCGRWCGITFMAIFYLFF